MYEWVKATGLRPILNGLDLGFGSLLDDPFDRPGPDPPAGHEGAGGFAPGEGPGFIEPIAIEHLGQQPHAAAAALAEVGAQREPAEGGRRRVL